MSSSAVALKMRSPLETCEARPLSDSSASSLDIHEHVEQPLVEFARHTTSRYVSISAKIKAAARIAAKEGLCWVNRLYANSTIAFEGNNDLWRVGDILCNDKEQEYFEYSAYARGVFQCTRVGAGRIKESAMLKIYML